MLFLTPKLVGVSDRREITVGSTSNLQVITASSKLRQLTPSWIIMNLAYPTKNHKNT